MTRTMIIAEAGVNHNGSMEFAKRLIDAASEADVDYVKFQTFKAENLLTEYAEKAPYQREATGAEESQFEMIKKLELSKEMHTALKAYCEKKNVKFVSSPFDVKSLDLLVELGVDFIKVPSGEIINFPFLKAIGKTALPVILSTGMSTLADVEAAMHVLIENGTRDLTLLHCNTEYPTPYDDVNLKAMDTLRESFKVPVGYSDHSLGIEVPIAAVARGAVVIEKHFTLDKTLPGPDHRASLDPSELKAMVQAIRNVESCLGDGIKKPSKSEKRNMRIARKSIVAKCDIELGEVFSDQNLSVKRPGTGISPMQWEQVVGKKAAKAFKKDELIEL